MRAEAIRSHESCPAEIDTPDPKQPERVYHDDGRGVYLIRQLMDDVQFHRGGREIRMWKY